MIFYNDNYHQILRLASPDDLRRINIYRDEAIERYETLEKLKKKVAEAGPENISKLPAQAREKLFRILYETDVEEQKYYNNQ